MPDLPPEEGQEFATLARAHNLDLIPLLAPTSTDSRIEANVQAGSGFVYCVSLTGVTGARDQLSAALPDFLARVRAQHTDLPLAVGFGVSRPEHVATIAQIGRGSGQRQRPDQRARRNPHRTALRRADGIG